MFLIYEYDIGNFNVIEYCIDIGDFWFIKKCFRCKLGCFVGGEEKYFEKMINVDVIELLILEWVVFFVFICKRDRGVRWCVYYLVLNKVMKMMYFCYYWWRSV